MIVMNASVSTKPAAAHRGEENNDQLVLKQLQGERKEAPRRPRRADFGLREESSATAATAERRSDAADFRRTRTCGGG